MSLQWHVSTADVLRRVKGLSVSCSAGKSLCVFCDHVFLCHTLVPNPDDVLRSFCGGTLVERWLPSYKQALYCSKLTIPTWPWSTRDFMPLCYEEEQPIDVVRMLGARMLHSVMPIIT